MTKKNNPVREKILKGLEISHIKLIQSKKERNLHLVISDNGRVIKVPAEELHLD